MKFINLIILCLIQLYCFSQRIGIQEIDTSKVKPWVPKFILEYGGVYHFGESELESDFILFMGLDKDSAQIHSGTFSLDGRTWVKNSESLTNVRIEGNKFYSDKTNGEFVIYYGDGGMIKGLKVFKPWSGIPASGEYEIGIKK